MLNRGTEDRPLPLSLCRSLSLSLFTGDVGGGGWGCVWGTSPPPSSGSATENDYSCHLCLCFNFWLRICYFKFWTPLLRSLTLWGPSFAALVKQILQQFYCSIHPFRNSVQASYFERFHWSILACCCSVFRCRHAPRSVVSKNSKLANENVQNN
jgi:hypothetical protein